MYLLMGLTACFYLIAAMCCRGCATMFFFGHLIVYILIIACIAKGFKFIIYIVCQGIADPDGG